MGGKCQFGGHSVTFLAATHLGSFRQSLRSLGSSDCVRISGRASTARPRVSRALRSVPWFFPRTIARQRGSQRLARSQQRLTGRSRRGLRALGTVRFSIAVKQNDRDGPASNADTPSQLRGPEPGTGAPGPSLSLTGGNAHPLMVAAPAPAFFLRAAGRALARWADGPAAGSPGPAGNY